MIAFPSNKICPRCKGEMQNLVITTYPPRYIARCLNCGYEDGNTIQKQTNADRLRAMSDEELDKFLGDVQWDVANYCGGVTQKQEFPVPEQRGAWLDWLREEVSDG